MVEVIKNRYRFVVSPDVENGSPSGDPDTDNLSRTDPGNGYGIAMGACLKHRICNYVEILREDEPGYRIYIREDVPLNRSDNTVYIEFKTDEKGIKELKKKDPQVNQKIQGSTCRDLFDIRALDVVMTTFVRAALNYGQVRGPAQLGFARSVDPITNQEVTITRVTITIERDVKNKSTETGGENIVPYTLYHAEGCISANLAKKSTGSSGEDLELLRDAIINTFEIDYSAARGKVVIRRLIMFRHSKESGDCPTYKLFDAVETKKNEEVEYPRRYGDHTITVHRNQMPVMAEVSERI